MFLCSIRRKYTILLHFLLELKLTELWIWIVLMLLSNFVPLRHEFFLLLKLKDVWLDEPTLFCLHLRIKLVHAKCIEENLVKNQP